MPAKGASSYRLMGEIDMAAWPELQWDREPQGPLKGIKVENSEGNTRGDVMRIAGQSPTGDLGPIFHS